MSAIVETADRLRRASEDRSPIAPIRDHITSIDQAYEVQRHNIDRRVAAGDRIVGRKIGLTSVAVQQQLGVSEPDFGTLLASMQLTSGDRVHTPLIQPKAEAEVAFILERDLTHVDVSLDDMAAAIAWAVPAIEIVDSRIIDWKISITDTVADNASSALYVLGTERRRLEGLDLRLCGMVLEKNGAQASIGVGAACLGHPLNAATWLARTMAMRGTPLCAGDIVLSGALGPMVAAAPGDRFDAEVGGLGKVTVWF